MSNIFATFYPRPKGSGFTVAFDNIINILINITNICYFLHIFFLKDYDYPISISPRLNNSFIFFLNVISKSIGGSF